jgi:Holliday junction DNA helicase RuvA
LSAVGWSVDLPSDYNPGVIGHLRGRLLSSSPEVIVLDVGGVGYEVWVPLSTYYEVERAGAGEEIGLHVRTVVRDDSLTLYGFWTERERLLFDKLLSVGGIGPKLARLILSTPPEDLLAALAAGDVARLTRTPGVGKKTAERMVVELKDKVQELTADLPDVAPAPADSDLVEALLSLGYKRRDAEAAATAAADELPDAPFHELLRVSLGKLSRA